LKTFALLHSFHEEVTGLEMRLLRKLLGMSLQSIENILQTDLFLSPPPTAERDGVRAGKGGGGE
jgi:hypothetical protein